MFGFSLDENGLDFSTHNPASSKLSSTSGPKTKSPMHLRRQNLVYIELITFSLTISPQSTELSIPKFDLGLVSSPRTSQSSQFSHSMPSPTTHATSNQFSQLEQPSCFSNPSRMDENNHPSRHLHTDFLLTSTGCCRTRREPSSSPPLSPALLSPPYINIHAIVYTLYVFYLPLPLPPPHDHPYFCAFMNSLSIKNF